MYLAAKKLGRYQSADRPTTASTREVASYMPEPAPGKRVCSNDVFQDERGLIYLIDRFRGLHILERAR